MSDAPVVWAKDENGDPVSTQTYVRQQAALETRNRLAGFAEGWEATGMEAYDDA